MVATATTELREFHAFLGKKIELGQEDQLLDEVFAEWQTQVQPLTDDDIEAIEEALRDIEAGDEGKPWEVFLQEIQQKYNLPKLSESS